MCGVRGVLSKQKDQSEDEQDKRARAQAVPAEQVRQGIDGLGFFQVRPLHEHPVEEVGKNPACQLGGSAAHLGRGPGGKTQVSGARVSQEPADRHLHQVS